MFVIRDREITMHRGDTGALTVRVTGASFASADRAIFTVCDAQKNIMLEQVCEVTNGAFTVTFANGTSDQWPAGNYYYQIRYAFSPEYGENDKIVSGSRVWTDGDDWKQNKLTVLDVIYSI